MVKEFEDGVKGQANGEYTKTPVKKCSGYQCHHQDHVTMGRKTICHIKDDVKKEYLDSKLKRPKFFTRLLGIIEAAKVQIDDADFLKDAVKELVDLANQPDDVSSQDAPSTTRCFVPEFKQINWLIDLRLRLTRAQFFYLISA